MLNNLKHISLGVFQKVLISSLFIKNSVNVPIFCDEFAVDFYALIENLKLQDCTEFA